MAEKGKMSPAFKMDHYKFDAPLKKQLTLQKKKKKHLKKCAVVYGSMEMRVPFFGKNNPEGMKDGRKERLRDMLHFRRDKRETELAR